MEPKADKLMIKNILKNLSDQDEYPVTMVIQGRCNLCHAEEAVGTLTVGSSEAIMLGGLGLKKRWQEGQHKAGKDVSKPNIIMRSNTLVVLEERLIHVSEDCHHVLDIHKVVEACDENTIGVFVILGSMYTSHFEDVKGLSYLLDAFEKENGDRTFPHPCGHRQW